MEQTYLKKINKAAAAELLCRKKIRLMILILVIVGGLFEMGEYSFTYEVSDVTGEVMKTPCYEGFFGMFLMLMGALFGAFAVFGVFSDLTNRQLSDVQLSLPMSAKDRYLSKVMAVIRIHILPLTISCAAVTLVRSLITPDPVNLEYLLRMNFVPISAAICVDAVCIFCMCCCGAKAEGVYTSIMMGFCISLTPYLFYNFAVVEFSGINSSRMDYAKYFSSFGGMCLMWIAENSREGWIYLMINAVLSCLLVYGTYFIYRKRDGRNVGKPVVFDIYLELLLFAGLFTVLSIFFETGEAGVGIVFTLIIVLVIRIIEARAKITPKIFFIWLGKYAIYFGAFMIIMGAAYFTGGFGYYKLRPELKVSDYMEVNIDVNQYEMSNEHIGGGRSDITYVERAHWRDYGDTLFTSQSAKSKHERLRRDYSGKLVSEEEAEELIRLISENVDKYYKLEDRSVGDFLDSLFSGDFGRKNYGVGTYVNISITGYDYSEDNNGYHVRGDSTYYLEFKADHDMFDELCEEFGGRLTLYSTDSTYNEFGESTDHFENYVYSEPVY